MPLLYNFDSNTLTRTCYPQPAPGERFTVDHITRYIDLVADSGVDTIVMNGNAQPPWYPSRLVPSVYDGYTRGDRAFFRATYPPLGDDFTQPQLDHVLDLAVEMADRFLDLAEAGIDWFAAVAEHTRRRGLTAWASIRMNDAHGSNSWEGCFMNSPMQRDPACRLAGQPLDPAAPPRHNFQLCNYAHQQVRDYYLALVRDAVDNYPYQGLELDWLRCPFCCNPPASDPDRELTLGFFREVRAITASRARQTGAPYPVALRIPCRLGYLREIGIDVVRLAEEGLIDSIAPSNFFQSTWDIDYRQLRDRLPEGIAIHGVVECTPNWVTCLNPASGKRSYRLQSTSPAYLRANAAGKLATGADGVYLFNFFAADEPNKRNPDPSRRQCAYDALPGLSDLANLRGTAKHYVLANQYGPWDFLPFETADQLPVHLAPGHYAAFRLAAAAEPPDASLTAEVLLERTDAPPPRLALALNGSWPADASGTADELLTPCGEFTHHLPEQLALRFRLPNRLRDDLNDLTLFNHGDTTAHVLSLELRVSGHD